MNMNVQELFLELDTSMIIIAIGGLMLTLGVGLFTCLGFFRFSQLCTYISKK